MNHSTSLKIAPTQDYTDSASSDFIALLEETLETRGHLLTAAELSRAQQELELCKQVALSCESVEALMLSVAKEFQPLYDDPRSVVIRIHEIARMGTLESCLSSLDTVAAFFDNGLCDVAGVVGDGLVIGRGHIAPAFYACRYVLAGMPFLCVASVHLAVPSLIREGWGFANTLRHSLGEGVGFAVGRAMAKNREHTVYCFVGDGELHEGVSCEAIRLVYEFDIKNFVLIIDENDMGIDPLVRPMNRKYIEAYFDQTVVVSGYDRDAIADALAAASASGERVAIICRTEKGPHSYKAPDSQSVATSCGQMAELLKEYESRGECYALTADLAARYNLKIGDYYNTGLAEASLFTLATGLPKDAMKLILTDDKYYLNSIDVLHSAFLASRNIHVVAGRKNVVWGGPTYVPTILSAVGTAKVYEVTDIEDLKYFIDKNASTQENGIYLFFDQPVANLPRLREGYKRHNEELYIKRQPGARALIISAEAVAFESKLAAEHYGCSHMRFLSLRPEIDAQLAEEIRSYDTIVVAEHSNGLYGLAEYIESTLLVRVHKVHDVSYEWPALDTFQSRDVPVKFAEYLGALSRDPRAVITLEKRPVVNMV